MIAKTSEVENVHKDAYADNSKPNFVCFAVRKSSHDPTDLSFTFEKGDWIEMYEKLDDLREPDSKYSPDFFFKVYPELSVEESLAKVMLQMHLCKIRMKKMVNIDTPSPKTKSLIKEYEQKQTEADNNLKSLKLH